MPHPYHLNRAALAMSASLAALALAMPVGAHAVPDFQLPTPTPTPNPNAQGPVVDGLPPPRSRPSPTQTPRPAPTRTPTPTPTATAAPAPSASRTPAPSARPAPSSTGNPVASPPPRATDVPVPPPSAEQTETPSTGSPGDVDGANAQPLAVPAPAPTRDPVPAPRAEGDAAEGDSEPLAWYVWLPAIVALLAALGFLALSLWQKRQRRPGKVTVVPGFVRPTPRTPGAPANPAAASARDANTNRNPAAGAPEPEFGHPPEHALRFALDARTLSLSLVNATLSYRITLTNTGDTPMKGIVIRGDMISAHKSLSTEDQLSGQATVLEDRHTLAALVPGQSAVFTGDLRVPLSSIRPIRTDNAAYFVPLSRWKIDAADGIQEALIQTILVGQRSPRAGGGLQPFRLDLGPRVYSEVTQRSFA